MKHDIKLKEVVMEQDEFDRIEKQIEDLEKQNKEYEDAKCIIINRYTYSDESKTMSKDEMVVALSDKLNEVINVKYKMGMLGERFSRLRRSAKTLSSRYKSLNANHKLEIKKIYNAKQETSFMLFVAYSICLAFITLLIGKSL